MSYFNRRRALLSLAASAAISGGCLAARRSVAQVVGESRTAEDWIDEWMDRSRLPVGALHLFRFKEPIYALTKSIRWNPNADQLGYQPVDVPTGFVTDFASIPRLFWSVLRPDGPYTYPAIVHDYLYWAQDRPRDVADEIFRFGMQDFDIDDGTIGVIYQVVRLGGSGAWDKNAKMRGEGERRVLVKLPDDPRTSWEDWKQRTDVFEP
jgi:hypothetical protein